MPQPEDLLQRRQLWELPAPAVAPGQRSVPPEMSENDFRPQPGTGRRWQRHNAAKWSSCCPQELRAETQHTEHTPSLRPVGRQHPGTAATHSKVSSGHGTGGENAHAEEGQHTSTKSRVGTEPHASARAHQLQIYMQMKKQKKLNPSVPFLKVQRALTDELDIEVVC